MEAMENTVCHRGYDDADYIVLVLKNCKSIFELTLSVCFGYEKIQ